METKLLLPSRFKKIGWFLFVPALLAGIYLTITNAEPHWLNARIVCLASGDFFNGASFFSKVDTNLANTIVGVLLIVGALLVGFSKEKNEDEFIAKIRLSSLLWAVMVNYLLLLFAFLFIYETAFLNVMIYNMFTVLLIFIGRFNYILYKNAKATAYEK
jgi:uncharacterized membrane protein YczE